MSVAKDIRSPVCSVKGCGQFGRFIFIDKSGGEMVVCITHHEIQQKIELTKAYKEVLKNRGKGNN